MTSVKAKNLVVLPVRMESANNIRTRFNTLRKMAETRRFDSLSALETIYNELFQQHKFAFKFSTSIRCYVFGFAWLETVQFNCQRISCKSKIDNVHEIKFCAMQLVGEDLRAVFKDEGLITGLRNALLSAYPNAEIKWSEFNSLQGHLVRHKDVHCPVCDFTPRPLK